MKKLNLGCGKDYREGYVNLDFNKEVKADIYADISKRLPFKDNTFDYILASHIIEHVPREKFYKFIEEIYRICKPGAIIDVFVPHFTSTVALKVNYHYSYFGIDSFKTFEETSNENCERYCNARFKVLKQELHFVFEHYENFPFVAVFRILNPLFNLGYFWKHLMERIWPFRFDEIYYKLEVVKEVVK
jgi:predicted SAM-dependent methyltransferase